MWEQQGPEREARADRKKSGHRLGVHRKANKMTRHQKSTETNQAAAPTWLAVQVRQNGQTRKCCGNPISDDGDGFRREGWLMPNEGTALSSLLLPQREPPTEDVNPGHGREGCQFITSLFQHPDFDMRPAGRFSHWVHNQVATW